MRNWRAPVLGLALTALAPVGMPAWAGEDADLVRQLRSGAMAFLVPVADADPTKPLNDILDVSARVAERARLPEGVTARLGEARAISRKSTKPFPDPGIGAALDEAYAALHRGRRFVFPTGIRTIEQAREACQREIDRAAAAIEAGRGEEATRGILEFLMMLTTPMEAH